MRPKMAMWSDYWSPTQKRWRSPYRRRTRSSVGVKILLAAVVCVAAVVGISGIYPHIIDSEWVESAGTHAKRSSVAEAPTRRTGLVTAIPLSPRGMSATTGEAAAVAPRAAPPAAPPAPAAVTPRAAPVAAPPAPAATEPPNPRSAIAVLEASPDAAALPPADSPDDQVKADPPAAAAPLTTPTVRPAHRYVQKATVVKKRVARTERRRGSSDTYAQYYGGGWGGGWGGSRGGGWPGLGSPFHF
jgi:hypothetical protein